MLARCALMCGRPSERLQKEQRASAGTERTPSALCSVALLLRGLRRSDEVGRRLGVAERDGLAPRHEGAADAGAFAVTTVEVVMETSHAGGETTETARACTARSQTNELARGALVGLGLHWLRSLRIVRAAGF